jgi:hypothetical protein
MGYGMGRWVKVKCRAGPDRAFEEARRGVEEAADFQVAGFPNLRKGGVCATLACGCVWD